MLERLEASNLTASEAAKLLRRIRGQLLQMIPINSITDCKSRVWSIAYDASGNLQTITLPVLGGSYYTITPGYNAAHDITSFRDPRGNSATYGYNADDSLAWEKDACLNQTTFTYSGGTSTWTTTVTDPNSHTTVYSYTNGDLPPRIWAGGYVRLLF